MNPGRRFSILSPVLMGLLLALTLGCRPSETARNSDIYPQDKADNTSTDSTAQSSQDTTDAPLNNGEFRDVLNEFMGLNERLERIASRIKIANADLCDFTENDIGLSTHTLNDYPQELQGAAQHYLNVGQGLTVRTVRPESPAHKAGLRTGDQIISINDAPLRDGPLFADPKLAGSIAKAVFHKTLDNVALTDKAIIDYQRGGSTRQSELAVTPKCKLPVTLFFSEDINGHLIDDEIWMTSGLLQTIREDVRVAYIMAHEMAHALRGHSDAHTPVIELDADSAGLIILARAGYDPDELATFWAEQIDLFDGGDIGSNSHPDLITRKDNYLSTLSRIKQTRLDDDQLRDLFLK